jgi:hypothetical protein
MRGDFRAKKEATDALDEIRGQIKERTFAASTKLTLKDYLEETWFPMVEASVLGGNLKPSTAAYYVDACRTRIIPLIGGMRLTAIDAAMPEVFYGDLLEAGRSDGKGALSRSTVHCAHVTLSGSLAAAVRLRLLPRSPAKDAEAPVPEKPEAPVWSSSEVGTFLEARIPLKVMSSRLGHSSTAITADTYSHVSAAVDQEVADRIAAHLFGT